jgi:hypothetical protein
MTDLHAVLDGSDGKTGLRKEIADAILALNPPDILGGTQYTYHPPTAKSKLVEETGRVRLFGILFLDDLRPVGIGSNSTSSDVDRSMLTAQITIWYADSEVWRTISKRDYWEIVRALIADQTFSSSDVCQRFVNVVDGYTVAETDDGFWLQIPVHCIVEHT